MLGCGCCLELVERLLTLTEPPDSVSVDELASSPTLLAGRRVLLRECVRCHDLRTILLKPKTPKGWRETVRRMADRSVVLDPIAENQQWAVTSYLIAISPELQRSSADKRRDELSFISSQQAAASASAGAALQKQRFDSEQMRRTFEINCALCHDRDRVDESPPRTVEEVGSMGSRMVENGMFASEDELEQIIAYLNLHYVK